ncbi:hypothetical protein GCM10028773_21190 [Spirosoma koreense]
MVALAAAGTSIINLTVAGLDLSTWLVKATDATCALVNTNKQLISRVYISFDWFSFRIKPTNGF